MTAGAVTGGRVTAEPGPAPAEPPWPGILRTAREQGVAPALRSLGSTVPSNAILYGPHGHAVVPAELFEAVARRAKADSGSAAPELLDTVDLPGGPVALVRRAPADARDRVPAPDLRRTFGYGLAWLRLGLSEGLRDAALTYLAGRRVGDDVPLLQQQLVKGAVADALADQLEVRATLGGTGPNTLPTAALSDLQLQLTRCDRSLVQLLGARGFLSDGPGQVCHISELLADAHRFAEDESAVPSPRRRTW